MQCGVCRIPFKLEYFGNDENLIQIFLNKIRENRRNLNNIEITNIRPSSQRNFDNIRNGINLGNNYRPNERDLQLENLSQRSDHIFIFLFHPNKFICFATLFVNVLISGFGTLILGVKNLNLYEFFLSLMQFGFSYPFFFKAFEIKRKKIFNNLEVNSFLWIYLIIVGGIFYLSSIYMGIFHNFIFFNPRKIKNKEKGICIIILNLIISGLGTVFFGIIAEGISCCERIKMWIMGIVQIFVFISLILNISSYSSIKLGFFVTILIFGILCYSTSVYYAIRIYKKVTY